MLYFFRMLMWIVRRHQCTVVRRLRERWETVVKVKVKAMQQQQHSLHVMLLSSQQLLQRRLLDRQSQRS